VLDKGQIIYDGSLNKVKSLPGLQRELVVDFPGEAPLESLRNRLSDSFSFEKEGERRLRMHFDPAHSPTADVVKTIVSNYEIADLTISEPTIDDVIIKIYRDGVS